MTGYLMVRCGYCGVTNKVRSLSEVPFCVDCNLTISNAEKVECGMLLGFLGNVDRRLLGVPLDDVRADESFNDLAEVIGSKRVEVAE
jgi:hypothetical protein